MHKLSTVIPILFLLKNIPIRKCNFSTLTSTLNIVEIRFAKSKKNDASIIISNFSGVE